MWMIFRSIYCLEDVLSCVWSKFLGGEGVVDGEGVAVKDAWSGVVGGSLRDLSKNILKQGVGKGKSCL